MSPGYCRSYFLLLTLSLITVLPTVAATYYVSPRGSDSNRGSLEQPFQTIRHAVSVATGGDLIYLRGGTYYPAQTIRIEQADGNASQRTRLFAYADERPIIDGSRFTVFDKDERDNVVFRIKAGYWHFRGLEIRNSPTFGITINGSQSVGNRMEELVLHDNRNTGLALIGGPAQTLVLNCDAYRNFDPRDNGQNGDGFSAIFDVGTGNEFRGCRSWANADDGYDLWKANNDVVIDQCWAYDNGFDRWDVGAAFAGNGEGFKLGREGGAHLVRNCLSWGNKANGYLSNSNSSGVTVHNSTGWNNQGLNFSFYGPEQHVLRNCVAYPEDVLAKEGTDDQSNSWNLAVTVDDGDFRSLSDNIARGERAADGSLPESDFLKLTEGSDLIDQGTDVGLPFDGAAPDLGAYEYGGGATARASNGLGRTEAEDMDLENYETRAWSSASGNQLIQAISLNRGVSASYQFTGEDGEYDLAIRYLDETDGTSTFTLVTNGVTTRQWGADQVTEGADQWKTQAVSGLFLRKDSRIEVQAGPSGGEYARLDYVEVTSPAAGTGLSVRARGTTGEEVMELRVNDQAVETWEVTTDWANYTYDATVVGNVRVAFVNDRVVDGSDRNLSVDKITVAGRVIQAEDREENTGAWAGRCGAGSFSEWLQCNGYIDFGDVDRNARPSDLAKQGYGSPTDVLATGNRLTVYPNPVTDGPVRVAIEGDVSSHGQLRLTDARGRLVLQQATYGVSHVDLDVESLPDGVYLLRMSGPQRTLTKKLVVQ